MLHVSYYHPQLPQYSSDTRHNIVASRSPYHEVLNLSQLNYQVNPVLPRYQSSPIFH